jgi:hypothetical protein
VFPARGYVAFNFVVTQAVAVPLQAFIAPHEQATSTVARPYETPSWFNVVVRPKISQQALNVLRSIAIHFYFKVTFPHDVLFSFACIGLKTGRRNWRETAPQLPADGVPGN